MSDDEDEDGVPGFNQSSGRDTVVLKEGFLKKKSPKGLLKPWQDRYFSLTGDVLSYYRDAEPRREQLGLIPIYSISTILFDESQFKKKGFRFDIKLGDQYGGRVFSFIAKSEADVKDWVEKIRDVQAKYQDSIGHYDTEAKGGEKEISKIWKDKNQIEKNWERKKQTANEAIKTFVSPEASATTFFGDESSSELKKAQLSLLTAQTGGLRIVEILRQDDFGTLYQVGDSHCFMTRKYLLLHMIPKQSPKCALVSQIMESMSTYDFPLFAQQIHRATTSDAVYAIYHPPLLEACNSTSALLATRHHFPEDVVVYLAVQAAMILEKVHEKQHIFANMSSKSLFIDNDGFLRAFDMLLPLPPSSVRLQTAEYACPEATQTTKSDFYRLGVFLYEIAVGATPITTGSLKLRGYDGTEYVEQNMEAAFNELREREVRNQLTAFDPTKLTFPDFVSANLRDLIVRLLAKRPEDRLASQKELRNHKIFAGTQWNFDYINRQHKPRAWLDEIKDNAVLPSNVTLQPEQVRFARLGVAIFSARNLPPEVASRLYCSVTVEKEQQKTIVVRSEPIEFNQQFVFEFLSNSMPSDASDIQIELFSYKFESSAAPQFIGSVVYPLNELRIRNDDDDNSPINSYLTIWSADGMPLGELHVKLTWRDGYSIQNDLQFISKPDKPFSDAFERINDGSHKLVWSILDQNSGLDSDLNQMTSSISSGSIGGGSSPIVNRVSSLSTSGPAGLNRSQIRSSASGSGSGGIPFRKSYTSSVAGEYPSPSTPSSSTNSITRTARTTTATPRSSTMPPSILNSTTMSLDTMSANGTSPSAFSPLGLAYKNSTQTSSSGGGANEGSTLAGSFDTPGSALRTSDNLPSAFTLAPTTPTHTSTVKINSSSSSSLRSSYGSAPAIALPVPPNDDSNSTQSTASSNSFVPAVALPLPPDDSDTAQPTASSYGAVDGRAQGPQKSVSTLLPNSTTAKSGSVPSFTPTAQSQAGGSAKVTVEEASVSAKRAMFEAAANRRQPSEADKLGPKAPSLPNRPTISSKQVIAPTKDAAITADDAGSKSAASTNSDSASTPVAASIGGPSVTAASGSAASPDDVPGNWRTARDAQTGDVYYYNKITRNTTWNKPACLP